MSNLVIAASAARTTTGQSAGFYVPAVIGGVTIFVNATAVTGTTPSMTLSLQFSNDGGTTWYTHDPAATFTFTAITTTGQVAKVFTANAVPVGMQWRLLWTITGTTPSFTFSANASLQAANRVGDLL